MIVNTRRVGSSVANVEEVIKVFPPARLHDDNSDEEDSGQGEECSPAAVGFICHSVSLEEIVEQGENHACDDEEDDGFTVVGEPV